MFEKTRIPPSGPSMVGFVSITKAMIKRPVFDTACMGPYIWSQFHLERVIWVSANSVFKCSKTLGQSRKFIRQSISPNYMLYETTGESMRLGISQPTTEPRCWTGRYNPPCQNTLLLCIHCEKISPTHKPSSYCPHYKLFAGQNF